MRSDGCFLPLSLSIESRNTRSHSVRSRIGSSGVAVKSVVVVVVVCTEEVIIMGLAGDPLHNPAQIRSKRSPQLLPLRYTYIHTYLTTKA